MSGNLVLIAAQAGHHSAKQDGPVELEQRRNRELNVEYPLGTRSTPCPPLATPITAGVRWPQLH